MIKLFENQLEAAVNKMKAEKIEDKSFDEDDVLIIFEMILQDLVYIDNKLNCVEFKSLL